MTGNTGSGVIIFAAKFGAAHVVTDDLSATGACVVKQRCGRGGGGRGVFFVYRPHIVSRW